METEQEKTKVLVADDELSMRQFLQILLRREGYEVVTAENGRVALQKAKKTKFAVILMDYNMPEAIDGIDLLHELTYISPKSQIIVITAYASTEQAIKSLELGAVDYVSKPFNVAEIRDLVRKCVETARKDDAAKEQSTSQRSITPQPEKSVAVKSEVIAESPAMKHIFGLAARIAATDSTVLLTGESGTGKEVVAKFIHDNSGRPADLWYAINCGAIPENLLESELFGHEKGSFTGAYQTKKGYFEVAGNGTLFLDEIGELSENMQVKLLRVLQERNFTRVGGTEKIETHVRLIAATNRNLQEQMKQGRFREDLYFRLNVLELHIPPLCERREDVLPLAESFLASFAQKKGENFTFSQEVISFFEHYDFPGNVRELKNMVERGTIFAEDGIIRETSLNTKLPGSVPEPKEKPEPAAGTVEPADRTPAEPQENGKPEITIDLSHSIDLDKILSQIERKYIETALKSTGFNRQATCELLGINERSLRYRIAKLGIAENGSE
ncbi:sigma-54-dependent Fis family transcriptional regulator [bacterium]|nr:sigma-54-dependent Fis family transcriptional regulator [bacterium]